MHDGLEEFRLREIMCIFKIRSKLPKNSLAAERVYSVAASA